MAQEGAGLPPLPAGGVPDLGALKKTAIAETESIRELLELAEAKEGLRCGGCGERINRGFEFVSLVPVPLPDQSAIGVQAFYRYACATPTCTHAIELARDSLAARVIAWMFMDDPRVKEAMGIRSGADVAGDKTKEEEPDGRIPERPGGDGAAEGAGDGAGEGGPAEGDGARD